MRFFELVRFALGAIIAHPMRSVLTSLGVVIGVAAVVMMTSIGLGASKRVTEAISGLGSNLIIVQPNFQRGPVAVAVGNGISLRDGDAEAIKKQVENVAAVAPIVRGQVQLASEGANWSTQIQGVTPDFLTARDLKISSGRMFDDREARQGRKVIVVGPTVVKELFAGQDPVGRRVRVRTVPFEVVGVLESKGQAGFGQDQDDLVVMPLVAFQRRIAGNNDITSMYVSAAPGRSTALVQSQLESLLRERRRITNPAEDDFTVRDMAEIAATMASTTGALAALLGAIAGVSLLVGGIGIMNIMLVSVTERTREIGIRLSIGALPREVLTQFLVEAAVLSSIGGLIGILLGLLGSLAASRGLQVPFLFVPRILLIAFAFSAVIGVLFGFLPARRAARLNPIEALRHE